MVKITKAQQMALKRKAAQARAASVSNGVEITDDGRYFTLRRMVQPMIGGGGAIVVPWCGMWLAIEPDGYTHT